jgi:predicted DCC family thiol-disulfide oxidoreductase YuxK
MGALFMKNGWTGGQYSIFRILLGCYLLQHFLALLPWGEELFSNRGALARASASPLIHLFPNVLAIWDRPGFVTFLLVLGALLSALLAVGLWDKPAAVALWYLWACLLGRDPLISNPALPFIGWILLLHAVLPSAPYGSWAARDRDDPRGIWHMPPLAFALAWMLMSAGYSYSGYTKLVSPSWLDGSALARVLHNPIARPTMLRDLLLAMPPASLRVMTWAALMLELSFAPLSLLRRARPLIWTAIVGLHLGLLLLVNFADLTVGMLLVHLLTFDPAWLRRRMAHRPEWVFYDGKCALCQGWVRFVLAEDTEGNTFRISPLQGELFATRFPAEERASLPDSLAVLTEDGRLLTRSAAVLHVLRRLGGLWLLMAMIIAVIPQMFLDWCYDQLALARKRFFGTRQSVCPVLSVELRKRFDA